MHCVFNLLVFHNSMFTPLLLLFFLSFLLKGLCALRGEIALKNNHYYYYYLAVLTNNMTNMKKLIKQIVCTHLVATGSLVNKIVYFLFTY